MSHTLPPLQWLRAFEAAARHSSFSAAARELNMTPSAISYQVRHLEEYFSAPLFIRLARGLVLTDIGRAYLPSVLKAFSDLSASSVGMFGSGGKLSIRIRVAISFGTLWLAPRLTGFLEKYPDIDVQMQSSLWIDNTAQQESDLEIRYGAGKWDGVYSEMLMNEKIQLVASSELKHHPKEITELVDRPLIHIMGVDDSWDRLFSRDNVQIPTSKRRIKVDTSLAAMEMAATGAGYALVFRSFAEHAVTSGKLIVPFDVDLSTEQSHHLVFAQNEMQLRPEVQLFRDWITEQASSDR